MIAASSLPVFGKVLETGHFAIQSTEFGSLGVGILAETPYALALCVAGNWDDLSDIVSEAQNRLTILAARYPSPRSWDLYVIVAIAGAADEAGEIARERFEHDTRYARKFIVSDCGSATVESVSRALRPLLPLAPPVAVRIADPLAAMTGELAKLGQPAAVVEKAMTSFKATGTVEIV